MRRRLTRPFTELVGRAKRGREWLEGLRRDRSLARVSRLESFGAIVQLLAPRALVFVDRAKARSLGIAEPSAWNHWDLRDDGEIGRQALSAPLEAHLQLTNQCAAGCKGCYTSSTPTGGSNELGLEAWKRTLDELASMGVFHLALGGGESADLPWLGEIAAYARDRGLIPNLTTSGLSNFDRVLSNAHHFGQINISMDGLGDAYAKVRGFDGFQAADKALRSLRSIKRDVGINVVVTRETFEQIDPLFAYAKRNRLSEVELLRFKPAGRGSVAYDGLRCTAEQHQALLPTVLAAAKRHRVRVKLDCSYTPMIACHAPDRELMASLAVYGCVGGDFLVGAKANGTMSACSFAVPPPGIPKVEQIADYWNQDDAFGAFRKWRDEAEPCSSCDYQDLCRGGCKAVSRHVTGNEAAPDPECPRVLAHRRSQAKTPTGPVARVGLPVVR